MGGRVDEADARTPSRRRAEVWPGAWSAVLAVLLMGGALGPGYVLSYDMVWVPDLSLGRDVLGLGSALPRAIPSDAVVGVLDEVLGGALLQKALLLVTLAAAGGGFGALVRDRSTAARFVAVSIGVWNPFVVERLVLGHWPLLAGYAVIPWLVVTLRDAGAGRLPARVPLLLVLGSLSASAGLATAVVALAVSGRAGVRRTGVLLACVLGANAPWVVAGLTSPAATSSDPVGAVVFATGDEGRLPGPLAALSFGGVWNAEVVPASRLGVAGLALTVVLVAAALTGLARVVRGERVPRLGALAACWCVGWGLATLSWVSPQALGWWGENVPAGGLVRDGSRLLGLAVPLVVVLVAVAVDALVDLLPDPATTAFVGGVIALLPVTLMPDALWGVGGRLDAVSYPAAYAQARVAVASAPAGDAVSLPFESYRAPAWNGGRRVLDPLARYLDRTTVVDDVLVVSGRRLAGEDPRSAEVAQALEGGTPEERAAALRQAGVSVVVTEEIEGYPVPEVAGDTVLAGDLTVISLGPASEPRVQTSRVAAVGTAWLAWLTVLLVPLLIPLPAAARRLRASRGRAWTAT